MNSNPKPPGYRAFLSLTEMSERLAVVYAPAYVLIDRLHRIIVPLCFYEYFIYIDMTIYVYYLKYLSSGKIYEFKI